MFLSLLEVGRNGFDAELVWRHLPLLVGGWRRKARGRKTSRRRRRWASSEVGRVASMLMAMGSVLVGAPILLPRLRVVSSLPLVAVWMISISHGT